MIMKHYQKLAKEWLQENKRKNRFYGEDVQRFAKFLDSQERDLDKLKWETWGMSKRLKQPQLCSCSCHCKGLRKCQLLSGTHITSCEHCTEGKECECEYPHRMMYHAGKCRYPDNPGSQPTECPCKAICLSEDVCSCICHDKHSDCKPAKEKECEHDPCMPDCPYDHTHCDGKKHWVSPSIPSDKLPIPKKLHGNSKRAKMMKTIREYLKEDGLSDKDLIALLNGSTTETKLPIPEDIERDIRTVLLGVALIDTNFDDEGFNRISKDQAEHILQLLRQIRGEK